MSEPVAPFERLAPYRPPVTPADELGRLTAVALLAGFGWGGLISFARLLTIEDHLHPAEFLRVAAALLGVGAGAGLGGLGLYHLGVQEDKARRGLALLLGAGMGFGWLARTTETFVFLPAMAPEGFNAMPLLVLRSLMQVGIFAAISVLTASLFPRPILFVQGARRVHAETFSASFSPDTAAVLLEALRSGDLRQFRLLHWDADWARSLRENRPSFGAQVWNALQAAFTHVHAPQVTSFTVLHVAACPGDPTQPAYFSLKDLVQVETDISFLGEQRAKGLVEAARLGPEEVAMLARALPAFDAWWALAVERSVAAPQDRWNLLPDATPRAGDQGGPVFVERLPWWASRRWLRVRGITVPGGPALLALGGGALLLMQVAPKGNSLLESLLVGMAVAGLVGGLLALLVGKHLERALARAVVRGRGEAGKRGLSAVEIPFWVEVESYAAFRAERHHRPCRPPDVGLLRLDREYLVLQCGEGWLRARRETVHVESVASATRHGVRLRTRAGEQEVDVVLLPQVPLDHPTCRADVVRTIWIALTAQRLGGPR